MQKDEIWKNVKKNFRNELMKIFSGIRIKKITSSFHTYELKYKVVVFAPSEKAEEIITQMSSSGAGIIGNYSVCSFRAEGLGTFMGNDQSNPSVGRKKNLETVKEVKIEMVCEKEKLHKVIEKIYEIHPYEEPAIDIYNVSCPLKVNTGEVFRFEFSDTVNAEKIIGNINKLLDLEVYSENYKKLKVKGAIVDYSQGSVIPVVKINEPYLLIRKNKTNIKIDKF